jgi:hypothetical protein
VANIAIVATTGPTSELQNAVDKAARSYRNSSEMRQLVEEQDRAREALRRTAGVVDISVELVREVRES